MLSKKRYPYYEDGKFKNDRHDTVKASVIATILSYISGLASFFIKKEKKEIIVNKNAINFSYLDLASMKNPIILPMGHATVLVIYKGKKFIFDPIFSSPSIFLRRYIPLIPNKEVLDKIDYVIISHDHPDHCDIASLKFLKSKNPEIKCFVPLEMTEIVKKSGINNIIEATWWQELKIESDLIDIKLTCLPAKHWSQHGLNSKRNKTLWCSWMLSLDDHNIYFAGDTAYGEHFKDIYNNFLNISCAFLPIAPYSPKEENLDSHMSPAQAYQAYNDLGKPIFVPIHWGVFNYGREPRYRPLEKIETIMNLNKDLGDLRGKIIGEAIAISSYKNKYSKENIEIKNSQEIKYQSINHE